MGSRARREGAPSSSAGWWVGPHRLPARIRSGARAWGWCRQRILPPRRRHGQAPSQEGRRTKGACLPNEPPPATPPPPPPPPIPLSPGSGIRRGGGKTQGAAVTGRMATHPRGGLAGSGARYIRAMHDNRQDGDSEQLQGDDSRERVPACEALDCVCSFGCTVARRRSTVFHTAALLSPNQPEVIPPPAVITPRCCHPPPPIHGHWCHAVYFECVLWTKLYIFS